jgi:flagellar protein FliS
MATPTLERYLEIEVLSADPVKLVRMMYRGAIEATSGARQALRRSPEPAAIAERARLVMKAWRIVHELASSLDPVAGGDLAGQLAGLYAYISQRLLDGNIQQAEAPLAEAEALLVVLAEAWESVTYFPPQPAEDEYAPLSVAY